MNGQEDISTSESLSQQSTKSEKPGQKPTRNDRRQILRARLITYKGGRCERCLKTFHPSVMEFHHRSPKDKSIPLNSSNLTDVVWPKVLQEADKCHLLCSNCHKEVHAFFDFRFIEP